MNNPSSHRSHSIVAAVARLDPAVAFWLSFWLCASTTLVAKAQSLASDGCTDLIWHHQRSGQAVVWFMRHTAFTWHVGEFQASGPPDWQLVATGDFDRNGSVDLFWHNTVDQSNAIWLMRDTNRLAIAMLPSSVPEYQVVGAGDFDNDGWDDILWRNVPEANLAIWFMHGTNYAQRVGWLKPPADTNWTAAAVGDCNLDGFADLFWRNRKTGENSVWILRGTNVLQELTVDHEPDLGFELIGTGRFTRTGHLDLIWRHRNGTCVLWLMQGSTRRSIVDLPTVADLEWHLAGTGGYTNSMMVSAAVSSEPPSITVQWHPNVPHPKVRRKPLHGSTWEEAAPNELSSQWCDTNVQSGLLYEYQVGNEYLISGVNAPPIHQRGRVLLLVDETLMKNRNVLAAVDALETNLVGDGWTASIKAAPRHDDEHPKANPVNVALVKSWIVEFQRSSPQSTNLVFILGHVAIPESGRLASDGHVGSPKDPTAGWKDHQGAWVADGYYGDIDNQAWTDKRITYLNSGFPQCENIPGDGKFDNDFFPTDLELGVGRVDFARLPCFQEMSSRIPKQRETDLVVQYLQKDHRYRHGELTFSPRMLMGPFLRVEVYNNSILTVARRHSSRWFGSQPDSLELGDPFVSIGSYLWAMMGGNGSYQSIEGTGRRYRLAWEASIKGHPSKVAFYLMQGSFFANWNLLSNNLLRGLLAAPDHGLAAMGYSKAAFNFHAEPLGMGETLGTCWKQNVNRLRPFADRWLALMGDPTLRLQVTPPPRSLASSVSSQINLQWQPPVSGPARFWVLRSANGLKGPWILLTPNAISTTEFSDDFKPSSSLMYQVRALRTVVTGSGSFTNVSQGVFARAAQ